MKTAHYAIWLILLAALQPTLLNYIRFFGVKPELFPVFIVVNALLCGKKNGAIIGAVFGFVFDILLGRLIGLHTILYMYVGFLTGAMSEDLLRQPNVLLSALAVLLLSAVMGCIDYLFRIAAPVSMSFVSGLLHVILPETVYNALLAVPIYLILKQTVKIFSVNGKVNEL